MTMEVTIEENKDKEYYQRKCYKLAAKLKEARQKLSDQKPKVENINYKTRYYNIKNLHQLQLDKNKQLVANNKDLQYQINGLKRELGKIRCDKIENKQLSQKVKTLEECLMTLTIKSHKAFKDYDGRIKCLNVEDDVIISFGTVLYDFEYLWTYQKLLEMHIADYVIDKLYTAHKLDNMTDYDFTQLWQDTKIFTQGIIYNLPYQPSLNLKRFKQELNRFTNEHTDVIRQTSEI